jgi:PHAX RNA-binding domain
MTNVDTRSAPEWTTWATLDDDGFLCTLGELSQRRKDAEHCIAETLGETEAWPKRLIHVIVKHIGTDQALAFLHEAQEVEQKGGLMLPDGSRRRTPGGVFFRLVRTTGPESVRSLGMWKPLPVQKKKAPTVLPKKVDTSKAAATNKNRQKVKQR